MLSVRSHFSSLSKAERTKKQQEKKRNGGKSEIHTGRVRSEQSMACVRAEVDKSGTISRHS